MPAQGRRGDAFFRRKSSREMLESLPLSWPPVERVRRHDCLDLQYIATSEGGLSRRRTTESIVR
jgi:hypothetical protein